MNGINIHDVKDTINEKLKKKKGPEGFCNYITPPHPVVAYLSSLNCILGAL